MSTSSIQPSFASGELSPNLQARVDLDKFHTGLAKTFNMFVDYRGGVSSRAGTRLVAISRDPNPNNKVRLIKFQFSVTQTYVLELGDYYMRVLKNGGIVTSGGAPYVIPTPWSQRDLALLKFAQSNDVMTITHPNYSTYDLARLADDNWQLNVVTFTSLVTRPIISGITRTILVPTTPAQTAPQETTIYDYVVTAVDSNGIESQPSDHKYIKTYSFDQVSMTIVVSINPQVGIAYFNVYKARPVITGSGGPNTSLSVPVYGYVGSTEGVSFSDGNVTPDFSRTPPKHKDPFAPGAIVAVQAAGTTTVVYSDQTYITVTDPTGSGARLQPIINQGSLAGAYIFDGGRRYTNPTLTVTDPNGGAGRTLTASVGPASGLSPGVVTYFQQRKTFAASYLYPATYWTTRPGQFNNMDISIPTQDSDATTFTLAALEQNPIKYMIPMQNGLVILTGGAAWLVSGGGQSDAFGPLSVKQTPQVYNGCADVQPLVIGYNILYIQEKGYIVQDLKFDFLSSVYTGEDRTYLSSHLFEGKQVLEWAWAEQPQKLIWAVMNSGALLSMTYLPEQKVYGWAYHETYGTVESIAVIPEGAEDYVYLSVKRPNGRFIERMESRQGWTKVENSWCLDCALQYSGGPIASFTGLTHVAGLTQFVIADGVALGELPVSPDGVITLPRPASTVLVGWGFGTYIHTMYFDAATQQTPQGRRKFHDAVTLRVLGAKAVFTNRLTSDVTVASIYQSGYGISDDVSVSGTSLVSGDFRVLLDGGWEENGQLFVRGTVGAPWTLTAVIPESIVGDQGG